MVLGTAAALNLRRSQPSQSPPSSSHGPIYLPPSSSSSSSSPSYHPQQQQPNVSGYNVSYAPELNGRRLEQEEEEHDGASFRSAEGVTRPFVDDEEEEEEGDETGSESGEEDEEGEERVPVVQGKPTAFHPGEGGEEEGGREDRCELSCVPSLNEIESLRLRADENLHSSLL